MPVTQHFEPPLSFIQAQGGAFRRALEDLDPLWSRFSSAMSSIEQERFDTRGYGDWPDLADSTIAEKAARGFPLDPLIRTSELRDSLTDENRAATKTAKSFTWGTDVEYADYHQTGTPRMPARPVLEIRTEDRQRLEREMVSWINETASRTWGRI